ncbi:hypothetical protein IFR05_015609 [Cadophora sp. M221]|nr:hypothetical protein IFR05_015609 [Cadophora sp. M221]
MSSLFLPRLVWIDSICINQKDNEEKREQIQLMQQIYRKAHRVTVCLGHDPHPASSAKQHTARADAYIVADILTELSLDQNFNAGASLSKYHNYSDRKSSRWHVLRQFLCHPWFTRIWVVQEVALARAVRVLYCGVEIPWTTLVSAVKLFHQNRLLAFNLLEDAPSNTLSIAASIAGVRLIETVRLSLQNSSSHLFAELLTRCRVYQSTDPRDKIDGMLGISSHIPDGLEVPNYEATPEKFYENCARKVLAGPGFQFAISSAGIGDTETPDLLNAPSWVTDWSRNAKCVLLSTTYPESAYRAGGKPYSPDSPVRVNARWITLSGCFGDVVDYKSSILMGSKNEDCSTKMGTHEALDIWRVVKASLQHVIRRLSTHDLPDAEDLYPHATQQYVVEACWRTLIGDRTMELRPAPAIYNDHFLSFIEQFSSFPGTRQENETQLEPGYFSFWWGICAASFGRRICVTDDGLIGLIPPFAMKGDVIFAARGLQAPLLLRKVDARTGSSIQEGKSWHYVLVGECYVHGIMDGVYGPDVDVEIF